MAATIGGSPTSRELRLSIRDTAGEVATIVIPLDGGASDANIQTFVDNYALVTNGFVEATLADRFSITGIGNSGKPANEPAELVASILAIDFQRTNPLNTAKTLSKQVLLPAYLGIIRNDAVTPHVPVTNNTALNAMAAFLEDHIDYVDVAGTHYVGGWTYNPGSKFGTKATVTDGL